MQQLIRLQEQEIERNEEVTTKVESWFDTYHHVQEVKEIEPLQVNTQVETYTLHEKGFMSPTHEYVLKEDFDKAIESMSQQVEQANKAVERVNEAVRDVNRDNQHNYEVERANVSLSARNEALERENEKYALEDVNSLNKSLEAEKGQLQQELDKANSQIQELKQANATLDQENSQLLEKNNHLENVVQHVVNAILDVLEPIADFPVIDTICEKLSEYTYSSKDLDKELTTVKEAEAYHKHEQSIVEREIPYDRGYDLER